MYVSDGGGDSSYIIVFVEKIKIQCRKKLIGYTPRQAKLAYTPSMFLTVIKYNPPNAFSHSYIIRDNSIQRTSGKK